MTAHQTRKRDGLRAVEGTSSAFAGNHPSAGNSHSCQAGKPTMLRDGVTPPSFPGVPCAQAAGRIPWCNHSHWPGLEALCFSNSVRRLLPKLLQTDLLCQITCLAGILSTCLSLPPLAVSTVYRQGNRNPMLRNFLLLFSFKSASAPDSLSLETT